MTGRLTAVLPRGCGIDVHYYRGSGLVQASSPGMASGSWRSRRIAASARNRRQRAPACGRVTARLIVYEVRKDRFERVRIATDLRGERWTPSLPWKRPEPTSVNGQKRTPVA